jgi:hypothetical protein
MRIAFFFRPNDSRLPALRYSAKLPAPSPNPRYGLGLKLRAKRLYGHARLLDQPGEIGAPWLPGESILGGARRYADTVSRASQRVV